MKYLTFLFLLCSSLLSAQDTTQNIGRIYGEIRPPSFLAEQLDTNSMMSSGGMFALSVYKLYDSKNTLITTKEFWIGGGCAYATFFDICNLEIGKYIMTYWSFGKNFSDTILLTKEKPVIKRILYEGEHNEKLKSTPTIIEQLEEGDTMTISTVLFSWSARYHLIRITKKENQYFLELKSDKTYSKILAEKDIYAIKCFEWDLKRPLSGRDCNDMHASYTIKWKDYTSEIHDNCDELGCYPILKYLLFEQ